MLPVLDRSIPYVADGLQADPIGTSAATMRAARRRHLLRLSTVDRIARFGGAMSDQAIEAYVERIDLDPARLQVIYADDREIVAIAELSPIHSETRPMAEVSFSVDALYRRRGLARDLLEGLLQAARARGFACLHAQVCAGNASMLSVLRRAGMRFQREGSEWLGVLELRP